MFEVVRTYGQAFVSYLVHRKMIKKKILSTGIFDNKVFKKHKRVVVVRQK